MKGFAHGSFKTLSWIDSRLIPELKLFRSRYTLGFAIYIERTGFVGYLHIGFIFMTYGYIIIPNGIIVNPIGIFSSSSFLEKS